MGFSPFDKEIRIGTMDEEKEALDSVSSDSSGLSSVVSSESDLMEDEEVTSSVFSPSPPPSSSASASNSSGEIAISSPLQDMSSLMHQLPLKRGLSNYFQGKSQSFTSLTSVTSLEDLAKPENPYNKKLKSCKSYGGLYLSDHQSHTSSPHLPRAHSSSRFITKKGYNPRGSCSSLSAKRTPSFVGSRTTPISSLPPHGSTTTSGISNHTPLFV